MAEKSSSAVSTAAAAFSARGGVPATSVGAPPAADWIVVPVEVWVRNRPLVPPRVASGVTAVRPLLPTGVRATRSWPPRATTRAWGLVTGADAVELAPAGGPGRAGGP